MDSKKPIYKSITFWVVVLFLLYSALGFLAVPYYIKKEITLIASNQLNSNIDFDSLSFNPYSFTTQIENVKITDIDSKTWFSSEKLLINLDLFKSIFSQTSIAEIAIDKPHYFLLLEHKKNTTQLKYPKIKQSNSKESKPFKMDISSININQGSLSFLDTISENPIELKFNAIGFKNLDFSTDDKFSTFELSLKTDQGDKAKFDGKFNYAQLTSSGNWSLNHFSTETAFKFIADKQQQFYGFNNQSGLIDAHGDFFFNANEQEGLNLTITTLTLENFSANSSEPEQPSVKIPKLQLKQAQIDLQEMQLNISAIDISNSEVSASFSDNNTLLWNGQHIQETGKTSSENSWQYAIDNISIKNSSMLFNKSKNTQSLQNKLTITTAEISNLSSTKQENTTVKLTIIPDNAGTVALQATVQFKPLKIDSIIDVSDINLVSSQAWIPNDIKINIERGLLSMHQTFSMVDDEYKSTGWIKFNDLDLLDENNQTFLKVAQLEFTENAINSSSKTIDLNNIRLDKAEGSLIVSNDSKLNIRTLISDQQEKQKIEDELKDIKNDWIINIKQVELIDSQTSFIDRSIKPSYQSTLTKINGTIKGLSSANISKADVKLKGTLDTYAQLDVLGKINPLSDKSYTDLSINISNLDLQNFSTYSTKFLGFPINRGKADFKLNYKLNKRLLKGVNNLKFNQLQLGNKIQNEDAINLPLKLAISLLTNNKGIMTINMPVSGRVDDPSFSYGGLVFKAFFKLITGIVASPFKLLGKLIPGGVDLDMSGIQFQAGTADLVPGEEEKLKAMQSILKKRPALILELFSTINTIEDYKALNTQLLLNAMQLDNMPDLSDVLSIKALKKTYKKLINIEQWNTLEINASKDGVLNHSQLAENAWRDLLKTFSQETEIQLQKIGKLRSEKIQKALIEDYKIPEKRIFLKPTELSEQLIPQVKFGIAN